MRNYLILRHSIRLLVAAISLCTFTAATLHAKGDMDKGLRFNSAGVLDLAERASKPSSASPAPITTLAAADAAKILAAPALSEEQPSLQFSDDVYGCKTPSKACSLEHEGKLIAAAAGAVKRDGGRLTIASAAGAAAVFVDWKMPATKTADGDEETHWYLGRMPGNDYHLVEVQFGHDAPGNFLINTANGKSAFVHNGSDVVVPAPDGMHLVTFNTLNPPLSVRMAALDAAGPRLQLQCGVAASAERARAEFKGWHDAGSFDLVIRPDGDNGKPAVPLRIAQTGTVWAIATPEPRQLAAIGFSCR